MNPAANTATSGGLAFAVVVVINSWFVALHFAPMDATVAGAYAMVITAAFGYFFHTRSLAPALPVAALDAKPAAAVVGALFLAVALGSYSFCIAPASAASAVMISGGTEGVFATVIAIMLVGCFFAFGFIFFNRGRSVLVAVAIVAVIFAGLALSGCTANQAANLQAGSQALVTGAQAVKQTVVTLQPVASDLACVAQTQANLAATVAEETHNADIASGASTASTVAGTFCNGLSQGAPLPQPVPVVAGITANVNGVMLPVPVAAVASSQPASK